MVWRDADPSDAFCDTGSSDVRFGFADVSRAEEELAVEVGDVNGIHVDYIDVAKARESQIFEKLTA
jgi:hypothetical protein